MWEVQLCELYYDHRERAAVGEVLESEWLTMGERVATFEKRFSDYTAASNIGVAVSSATAGLHLILMAAGIGQGDEVIIPGLTFVSDANVICQLGATPIFADSQHTQDLNVSVKDIVRKISPKTKAIVIVHFAGYPLYVDELMDICAKRGILLIEDVAHAPGALIDGKMCGTLGDAAFFSFFSNKNLAVGEGGMVLAKCEVFLEKIRSLRSHGMSSLTLDRHKGRSHSYGVDAIGLNYRMDEMRAAIGIVQLEKLPEINAARRELVHHYISNLTSSEILIPFAAVPYDTRPAYHIMPIILPDHVDRVNLMYKLRQKGIQTSIHYPAFHSFSAYKKYIQQGDLPIVDEITEKELTLPLHPKMTNSDVDFVCENLVQEVSYAS